MEQSSGDESRSKCEFMVDQAMKNGKVAKVISKMESIGCKVPKNSFFLCKSCNNESYIAAYVGQAGRSSHVMMCEDNIDKFNLDQEFVTRAVLHELIHAYDHCRSDMDWKNCLHVACSEVRAANLSGDCSFVNEVKRGNFGWGGQGEKCIKRRAELSVQGLPHCKAIAKRAVESVYEQCYLDRSPLPRKCPEAPIHFMGLFQKKEDSDYS